MSLTKCRKPLLFIFVICLIVAIIYVKEVNISRNIIVCEVDTNKETIDRILSSKNQVMTNLYYINLQRSTDRRAIFLQNLPSTFNPILVDAVSPDTQPRFTSSRKCSGTMDTEFACTSSHIKAIHTAYHNNEQFAIIAEDDSIIVNNIDWHQLMKSAPFDWEVLQLHTCCIPRTTANKKVFTYFNKPDQLWLESSSVIPSAAFYIISREAMEKVLSRYVVGYENKDWDNIILLDFTSTKLTCQADLLLYDDLKRYVCTQHLIDIRKSKSTIHWSHNGNDYSHYQKK